MVEASQPFSIDAYGRIVPGAYAPDVITTSKDPQGSAIGAGLRSGGDLFVKNLGGAAAALGQTVGSQTVQDFGVDLAKRYGQYATAAQRPDLEDSYGPSGLLYKGAQMLPSLGAMLGGAVVGGLAGGPLGVGAGVGAFLGGAATAAPETAGQFMNTAMEQPGGADGSAGFRSLALGLPLGALMAAAPPGVGKLEGLAGRVVGEKVLGSETIGNMVKGGLVAGSIMGPQAGLTTAVDQTFRDDPGTLQDRLKEISKSAIEGFTMGGLMGGAIGGVMGRREPLKPNASNADLAADIDAKVKPPVEPDAAAAAAGEGQAPPPPPSPIRAIEDYPIEELQGLQETLAARGTKRSTNDNQALARIEAEMTRREATPEAADAKLQEALASGKPELIAEAQRSLARTDPAQQDLGLPEPPPGEQPVSRAMREQQEAVAAQQKVFVDQAKELGANRFAKKLEANPVNTPEDFAMRVYDEYDPKVPSMRDLGKSLGLVDEKGQKYTRETVDIALKQAHVDNIINKTEANGVRLQQLEAARNLIDTIEQKRAGTAEVKPFEQDRASTQGELEMPDLPPPEAPKLPLEIPQDLPLAGFSNPLEMIRGLTNNERAQSSTKMGTPEHEIVRMMNTEKLADLNAKTLEPLGLVKNGERVSYDDAIADWRAKADAAAQKDDPVGRGQALAHVEQLNRIKAVDEFNAIQESNAARITTKPLQKAYQELEKLRRQLPPEMANASERVQDMQTKLIAADTAGKSQIAGLASQLTSRVRELLDGHKDGLGGDLPPLRPPQVAGTPTPEAQARVAKLPKPKLDQGIARVKPGELTPAARADLEALGLKVNPDLARISTPETRTQMDTDIEHLLVNGASGKDLVAHIAETSADPFTRQLADRLAKLGVDAKIEFASPDGVTFEGMHALQPDQKVTGSYNRELNRVNVYDRSNLEATVMHEMVHAATAKAIDRGQHARSMTNLFEAVKNNIGGDFHGLKNMHEFVAETMTNPRFQEFLKTVPYQKTGNVVIDMWSHFKNIVFKALGMDERVRTAFDQAVEGGNKIMEGSAVARDGVGTVPDVERQVSSLMDELPRVEMSLDKLGEGSRAASEALAKGAKNIKVGTLERIKRIWNDSSTSGSIVRRMYDETMKAAGTAFMDGKHQRTTVFNQLARINGTFRKSWEAVSKKGQGLIADLTEFDALNINPAADWKGNVQVHDNPAMMAEVARGNELYRKLKQTEGEAGVKAYEDAKKTSQLYWYGHQISRMEQFGRAFVEDLGLKGFDSPMIDRFGQNDALHNNLDAAHEFMKGEYAEKMGQFKEALGKVAQDLSGREAEIRYIEDNGGKAGNKRTQVENLFKKYGGLMEVIRSMEEATSRSEQVPNFHKGRYGDWGVSAYFNVGEDGKLNAQHIREVQRRLEEATGGKVELRVSGSNPKIFMRFENQGAAQDVHAILKKAQADDLLVKDDPKRQVKYGSVDDNAAMSGVVAQHVLDLWEQVTAKDLYKDHTEAGAAAQAEAKRRFMSSYLDSIPDDQMSNILQKREFVQGASGNILRNMITRNNILAHDIAHTGAETKINAATGQMRARIEEAKGTMRPDQIDDLQRDFKSLLQYEHEAPKRFDDKFINLLRSVNHAYFLGFSPGYVIQQLLQPAQTALPELGKHFGFAQSAVTMTKVLPDVTRLMATIIKTGGLEGLITREALLAAGHNEKLVNVVMRAVNDGTIDLSGPVRELQSLQQGTEGQYHNKLIKLANTLPMHSETASRLVALLSADRLFEAHPEKARIPGYKFDAKTATPAEMAAAKAAYTRYFVQETMGRYGSGETPRVLTNKGPLGTASPLAGTFMSYHLQMFEKLVHEMHGMWDKNLTHEERVQSRKYMAGHMAAMATLTGTMGLPFFNLISGLATKFANAVTGRDDNDVASSYRSYLSDVFSPTVSDVIARGLPRAVGVDMSNLSEADMAPFTQLIVDRRKWSERLADLSTGVLGAPGSMLAKIGEGGFEMANGRWLEGAIKAAPTALANPLKAYKLQTRGYQTSTGLSENIEAGPGDVIAQLMGVKLSDPANYSEASHTASQLRAARQIRSQNLTKNLLDAYENGDTSDQAAARAATRPFDQQHPNTPILTRLPGMLTQRRMQEKTAEALGIPVGGNMLDLGTNKLLRYMNK